MTADGLHVRPARADDLEAVAQLYLAARAAAIPAMPPQIHSPDEVRHHVGEQIDRDEVWVAEAAGEREIVAFMGLSEAMLDDLYVLPNRTGDGVGSALLDMAKSLRPTGFTLWVFESNEGARRFYRARGLVEAERTDGSGNEEQAPDVRMAWPGGAT